MTTTIAAPTVVFGKLSGFGFLLVGLAALIAAGTYFLRVVSVSNSLPSATPAVVDEAHDFQLVQLGEFRRDQFLVDKRSGRVWHSICTGEAEGPDCKGLVVWEEMYVDGVTPGDSPTAMYYRQQVLGRK